MQILIYYSGIKIVEATYFQEQKGFMKLKAYRKIVYFMLLISFQTIINLFLQEI